MVAAGNAAEDTSTYKKTDSTLDPTIRLRIATRIHFALLRHYGEDVSVSTLLGDEGDAREALWVCEASGHDELVTLAKQFRAAPRPMPVVAPRGAVPQEMPWSQDTSGFGLSRPPETMAPPTAKPARRSVLLRWLDRSTR